MVSRSTSSRNWAANIRNPQTKGQLPSFPPASNRCDRWIVEPKTRKLRPSTTPAHKGPEAIPILKYMSWSLAKDLSISSTAFCTWQRMIKQIWGS
eukprot:s3776_g1.t1